MHSHLLPGLDDGVKTLQEAGAIIRKLMEHGYRKAVTTPHIMGDTYKNTPAGIEAQLLELKAYLLASSVEFEVEAAAEYYLDESLMRAVDDQKDFLTFGNRYLLFETNYLSEPYFLNDFIFKVFTRGFKPVLAHPERYHFMTVEKLEALLDRDVLLQCNMLSLSGYYGKPVQRLAEIMIEKRWVHFLGTDCHNPLQADLLPKVLKTRAFQKAVDLPLLNYSL